MTKTNHRIILFILSITLAAAAGCKEDDTGTSGSASAKPADPPPVELAANDPEGPIAAPRVQVAELPPVDLAAINGATPKDLGLVFESRSIEDEIQAVVPVGWNAGLVFPGKLTPPSDSNLGFSTRFNVGSGGRSRPAGPRSQELRRSSASSSPCGTGAARSRAGRAAARGPAPVPGRGPGSGAARWATMPRLRAIHSGSEPAVRGAAKANHPGQLIAHRAALRVPSDE